MRPTLLIALVVALGAAVAQASMVYGSGAILTEVSFEKTVAVGSTTVHVWKITQFTADPNVKLGAVILGFGDAPRVEIDPNEPPIRLTPEHGPNPYQAWMQYTETAVFKTVSQADANSYITTDPSARDADTHFIPSSSFWLPIVISPDELNDYSIYDPGTGMGVAQGLGALYVQASIGASQRLPSHDIAHVGVVGGGGCVWGWTGSADELGNTIDYEFPIPDIPEPGMLTLLGLGTLGLIRRRR